MRGAAWRISSMIGLVLLILASGNLARPANANGNAKAIAAAAVSVQAAGNVPVIEISAKKYEFDPSPIHVKQGAKVQLKITATDHDHGFKLLPYPDGAAQTGDPGLIFADHQDCWKIEKGQSVTVEFEAKTPGTYTFKCCNFCGFGHGKMKGQLIVDPS
ncbi:MAG TPA: cupredoxin domain-containing protein [Candidatus Acidoferrales bacterium]|nr:cupredoxin domain-containing protein [Candidatus Acidoferrales bacterium]